MSSTSDEDELVQLHESDSTRKIRSPIPQLGDTLIEGGVDHLFNLRPSKHTSEASNSHSKKQHNSDEPDIFYSGTFDSARIVAQNSQKWLMVNIEHSILTEWRMKHILRQNNELKNLVSQNFLVWQEYQHSKGGIRYKQFYQPVEFPYIAILDPRTGEKLEVCHDFGSTALLQFIHQFVSDHQNPTEETSGMLLNSSGASSEMTHVQETSAVVEQNDTEDTGGTRNRPKNKSKVDIKGALEAWKKFLEGNSVPKLELVIRLPNGERKEISWACTTKVKSLYVYIEELGYDMKKFEIITVHPRYTLTLQDSEKTLEEVNLCTRQVLFLQLKINVSD